MSSLDDLKAQVTTSTDFYELLGISPTATDSEITKAYRKTSLKYHPDKQKDKSDASIIEKFHLIGVAKALLTSPELRNLYDNARAQRKQRELQNSLLDGKRRRMKEDLEGRERGFRKRKAEEMDAEAKLEMEIRRLAEDGKRRRREREEQLRRQDEDGEASVPEDEAAEPAPAPRAASAVAEIDRTIKVRWMREGSVEGATLDKEKLTVLFSKFGKIDSALVMKDKKTRLAGEKHKKLVATGFIVYHSIVSAHSAVLDARRDFVFLDSVSWANKEPELQSPPSTTAPEASAPSTPAATPKSLRNSFPGISNGSGASGGASTPSFSFSPQSGASPSLYENTMMRLKQKEAERRRLEEQIREKEATEAVVD
ncbi:DnaJ-domain-containing protein [Lepidopterella palustris CBS 459.81]|uniref:DnaJ-domain-containing protein n=1 Tax=Lepidopterella palustris CBS 459.81 TaxID=1314670 RepID=A0A8E2E881_9PEZI|nr:DnaJ-domain-containing protein [Lepidopterella palustris CBS 459.81]